MTFPKVSIIFPTYNGWEDTNQCLISTSKLNYPKKNLEVIVVDNNSQDKTPGNIRKFFPDVKVIQQKENLGYAKAVNIALKRAFGAYILFSNNDIVLDKNYIKSMVALANSDAKIGVLGGMTYLKEPKGKIGFNGLMTNPYLGYHQYGLANLDRVQEIDLPPAGGFFVKKSLIDEIGALDEGFFIYSEDLDFCIRAKRSGYKVVFNPRAIAYHGHAKTTYRENFYKIVYQGYKSKWRCILKNAYPLQIATSLAAEIAILAVTNIKAKPKTVKPITDAILWNFKNLGATIAARKKYYAKAGT